MIKRLFATILSVCVVGMSVAFLLKASIGIGPYDAFTLTFSNIVNIKIGTMSIILNGLFLIVQIILLKKEFSKIQLLQILVILSLGSVINIFYYDILVFELKSYFTRMIFFMLGTVLAAFSVASIMNINFVYTSLEGFIHALSYKTNGDFVKYRWGFDIFCVVTSIALSILFKMDIVIREGTILSLLLFSPLMGYFMRLQAPYYEKWRLKI